jgi:hypothetical protein
MPRRPPRWLVRRLRNVGQTLFRSATQVVVDQAASGYQLSAASSCCPDGLARSRPRPSALRNGRAAANALMPCQKGGHDLASGPTHPAFANRIFEPVEERGRKPEGSRRAVSRSNHSTSRLGNSPVRPDRGGHSISVLLAQRRISSAERPHDHGLPTLRTSQEPSIAPSAAPTGLFDELGERRSSSSPESASPSGPSRPRPSSRRTDRRDDRRTLRRPSRSRSNRMPH